METVTSFVDWFSGNLWTFIDALITISTLGFVVWNFFKNKKNENEIEVYLDVDGKKEKLTTYLLRKQTSRAEIQGILRTKLKKGKNVFDIEYLSNPQYAKDISQIQKGDKDDLIIKLTKEEREDFLDKV